MKVTVIVDNESPGSGLLAEHGLALWVEADGTRLLFDTGQGDALVANAGRLGVALEDAHAVVLSHGHYDHTGGLARMTGNREPNRIYLHPAAVRPRYSRRDPPPAAAIGMPSNSVTLVRRLAERAVWTTDPVALSSSAGITGQIPRRTEFESTGGRFFLDSACTSADAIDDDQAVWVKTERGFVVIFGCAHAGAVNTLDHLARLLGVDRFHAVVGGLHLRDATEERITSTAEALNRYRVETVAVGHCTGREATAALRERCRAAVVPLAAGMRLEF